MTETGSTVAPERRHVRPFGMRDKVGYMFGDFGNDMTFMIQAFFMLVYFTRVVGIDPLHIGALVAGVRVLDAFTDVGMGRLVDTMRPARDGKFKPWIRRIAIPVALSSALLFQPFIADWAYGAKLAWMIGFYILWGSVFYTAINIPYGSMASVISDRAEHRAELSVWRSTGAQLAFLLVSTAMPLVVFDGPNVLADRFGLAAILMAVMAVVFYALLYFNVEERVVVPPKPAGERMGFFKLMGSLFTNRALLAIVVAALLLLLGNLFNGQVASFLYLDYFGQGQLQSIASLAATLPAFVLVVVTAPLVRRFGKTEMGIVGVALYVGGMLANYFLRPAFPVFVVLFAIASFGLAVFNFLIWAFIVDVIDYQEVRSGQRDDGTVYALYSWARKMGQAASSLLGGIGLTAIGYQATAAQQTPETIEGIWMLFNLVPALFLLGTLLVLIFWYPLRKNVVRENEAILAERRAAVPGTVAADAAE
ncbi:MFS transporter [Propioniciclava soli]|uniref:Glycoside-pentoside-hexuronide (GPH):cation symporter n=1 Tax=Propioniciclava soli TaxID=2775081 RepID=A0ABZ3CBD5_9ACTN|nr:glycoside-pentoside-hexuronide (GPH):cation symporter [Propioniciclava soli]